jgi:hypothetical protein
MIIYQIIVANILFFSLLSDTPVDKSLFVPPVNIPILLSANFGELRIDHFHSGIDIKTQGVTGKEVVSAANGYVYRITVSPGGFGNALYIKHPSGYTTVYGHLDRFIPEIEEYIKERQYEKKNFAITLYPSKEKFSVKQGELIAFSGNSGSSGGPHLHYEIRKSDNEKPVNPLSFEFGTSDNIDPVIEKLFIYPMSENTSINGKNSLKKIDVAGGYGNYYIPAEKEITIAGIAGFGIKSFDLLNESYNKCAVYSIELAIDSMTIFKYIMDEFSFYESRYINSHIDYETYMQDKFYVERTFLLPNDRLSVYHNVVNRGIFSFNDDKTHSARITVKDISNNTSTLSFKIKSQIESKLLPVENTDPDYILMPYNKQNRFISENIKVNIPAGALYDTLKFRYNMKPGSESMFSDIHQVHNKFAPVHKAYSLAIRPILIPAGKESKLLIVQIGEDQKKTPLNSTWNDDYLSAESASFGDFCIDIDTIPPVISANGIMSDNNLSGKKEMRIKITDNLSGIKAYEPEIDGNWALFEYDQKNDVIVYRFDEKRIRRGSEHKLELKVTDNKDNTSYFNYDFTW